MAFVLVCPDALAIAAGQLRHVGSVIAARNAVAAPTTAELAPAAADEVSALTATQFNFHAAMYQAVGAQAIAMNEAFVAMLGASADSYAATEAANIIAVS